MAFKNMPEPPAERATSAGPTWLLRTLWVCLLLGCILRFWNAWKTSFWLDDFHSLHHARASDLSAFFSGLLADNHPPLSLLLLRLADRFLGSSEWSLHVPNFTVALLSGILLWRLGARSAERLQLSTCERLGGLGFLSLSAMHVDLSSNLRMYALLGLCVLGLLNALVTLLEHDRGRFWVVFWSLLGLHTHYHFLHAGALLGLVSLGLVFGARRYRPRLRSLLVSMGFGLLLALPWYALGFRQQLAHGLPPGGSQISPQQLATSITHLLHQGLGASGAALRPLLFSGALLGLVLAGLGQLQLFSQAKRQRRPAAAILIAATAFLLPLWSAAAAALSARAGFESRYLVGALAPMALLAGVGAFGAGPGPAWSRLARPAAGLYSLAAALWLSVLLAASGGHEDYRAASAHVLAEARPGDAVLAADWQPELFPHGIGWAYYSGVLAESDAQVLATLEHDATFNLLDPERLTDFERVHCVLRSIPRDAPLLRKLRSFYAEERAQSFGRGVFVLTFSQPKPR